MGDELAFDVLVASSTPGSGDIRNKFQNSTTGIVNWEEAVDDDDSGEFQLSIVNKPGGKTQINIVDNTHPITSGFSKGLTTIFTGGTQTIAQDGNISIGVHALATENNNNAAASPGYQLCFWDDSAGTLTLLAKDDVLGILPGDLFASESVSGSQDVAPGDMLLMAIDDGGNGHDNDRTIVQAYISPATGAAGEIPEPMTMLAVGLGLTGLGGYIRKRRRA